MADNDQSPPKSPSRTSADINSKSATASGLSSSSKSDKLAKTKSFRDSPSSALNGTKTSVFSNSQSNSTSAASSSKPEWNNDFIIPPSPVKPSKKELLTSPKGPFISKTMSMSSSSKKSEFSTDTKRPSTSSSPANVTLESATSKPSKISSDRNSPADTDKAETRNPTPVEDDTTTSEDTTNTSPDKKRDLRVPTASSTSKARAPLYANRYSSAAEAVTAFHDSLRNTASFKPVKQKSMALPPPPRVGSPPASTLSKNGTKMPMRRDSSTKQKFTPQYNDDAAEFLSSLRTQRGGGGGDGRPTTGAIEEQWQFLRSYFKMADDDLEWLMVAKHKGAYKYATNKHDEAEDRYFKGLAETEAYELQYKQMMQAEGIGEIPGIISQLSELYISNLVVDPTALNNFNTIKEKLRSALEKLEISRGEEYITTLFSSRTIEMFKQILTEGILPSKAVRRAKELNASVKEEFGRLKKLINDSKKFCDDALDEMEKWSRRTKEADEYTSAVREEEDEWLDKEYDDNYEALCLMRSYIPVNIADLSVNELINMSKQKNGWFTLELAFEIKNNRLLHWLVTHKDDIAMANFLAGEKKAYFENIETLDIIELRALVLCLPEKFELDGDGKKNEWRSRVMARAKQMVSQQKGDSVKGAYDIESQKRIEVKLAPLKPDQERRSVYYYRSKDQSLLRLKQYDDKEVMLKKKTAWLASAKSDAEEAKKEYDIILNEMRDVDLKAQYGADQVNRAKKMAKEQWSEAESKRKTLDRDVTQLKATIAGNPVSREEFLTGMKETEDYLTSKGFAWDDKEQPPILMEGVFDKTPEINRTERKATKFVSAEEEANIRKGELAALKAQKDANATAQVTAASDGDVAVGDATTAMNSLALAEGGEDNVVAADPSIQSTPGIVARRRSSILDSSNPDMLKTLNRMMSTTDTPTPMPIRRGSSIRPPEANIAVLVEEKKVEPKEIKVTKSKLLMKISGGSSDPLPTSPMARPAMPSFLDQLKSRGKNPIAADITSSAADDGGEEKPKTSFLDELKLKSKKGKAAA